MAPERPCRRSRPARVRWASGCAASSDEPTRTRSSSRSPANSPGLGSPAFRRDLCEGGTAGDGLNEIGPPEQPSCGGERCRRAWTRDGLPVDPAPWNPGLKYGARRRKSYEDQGCAELHLGRGTTPRPDTLAQTGQITSLEAACRRGGPYVFWNPRRPLTLVGCCSAAYRDGRGLTGPGHGSSRGEIRRPSVEFFGFPSMKRPHSRPWRALVVGAPQLTVRATMTTIRQFIHNSPAKAMELFAKVPATSENAIKTRERLFAELKTEL